MSKDFYGHKLKPLCAGVLLIAGLTTAYESIGSSPTKVHTFVCKTPSKFGLGVAQIFTFKTVNTESSEISFFQSSDHATYGDYWIKVEPDEHAPLARLSEVSRRTRYIKLSGDEDGTHVFNIFLSKRSNYTKGKLEVKPAENADLSGPPEVKMGRYNIRCSVTESFEEAFDG